VRKGNYKSNERRLKNMLMYYFDTPYSQLFGNRIICIDGDITDKNIIGVLQGVEFDTLINCAACVKHFADKNLLENINVNGVNNLIELCKKTGKKLVQISTVSVGGEGIDGTPAEDKKIREKDLFFNQSMTNDYIRTKFMAERQVLSACCEGLRGKVIRVGNLMSRHSDGEFQINFITNGFLRTLRGYTAVGKFPINGLNEGVEFSPIDETADAVLKLAATNAGTVFHACNSHRIFMGDVIYALRESGFNIDIVSATEFESAVNEYAAKNENSDAVSGLIAYNSREDSKIYTIDYDNNFTTEVLYRLAFKWNITDNNYLINAIKALDNLDFFGDKYFCNKKEND
jgi:thioester reductase-like protein